MSGMLPVTVAAGEQFVACSHLPQSVYGKSLAPALGSELFSLDPLSPDHTILMACDQGLQMSGDVLVLR